MLAVAVDMKYAHYATPCLCDRRAWWDPPRQGACGCLLTSRIATANNIKMHPHELRTRCCHVAAEDASMGVADTQQHFFFL